MLKKYFSYVIIFTILFITSCSEPNCQEGNIFLNPSLVDTKAKVITSDQDILSQVEKSLDAKKLYTVLGSGLHQLKFSVAVNNKDNCNHIGVSYEGQGKIETAKLIPYLEKIKSVFSNLKYQSAKVGNEKVNSFLSFPLSIKFDETGKVIMNWTLTSGELSSMKDTQPKHEGFFTAAEVMPEIIGGIAELAKNIVYPDEAKEKGIQGKVFVKVYIDENGNVFDTEIVKSVGSGCDEAAINAINKIKFKPAIMRGKPVKSVIVIPIMFKLS